MAASSATSSSLFPCAMAAAAALTAAGKDTFPWERLFSHHFPLGQREEAVKASMTRESMKVVIAPWME